jgi:Plant transposon protein
MMSGGSRSSSSSSSGQSLPIGDSHNLLDGLQSVKKILARVRGGLPESIIPILMATMARKKRLLDSKQHGGSRPGKRPNRDLGREEAAKRLQADYFMDEDAPNPYGGIGPTFSEYEFQRRLRISRRVYARVKCEVLKRDTYFEQRSGAVGKEGATADQKICVALMLLGQGIGSDSVVEVSRLSESTAAHCLKRFVQAVVNSLGDEFLRLPSAADLTMIESSYCKMGLPGCIGAVDCASWQWGNCPVAEQGVHRGKDGKTSLRLEAWCDDRLWVWSLFFGMPGSRNDINIMNASPLFQNIRAGSFPPTRPSTKVRGTIPLMVLLPC